MDYIITEKVQAIHFLNLNTNLDDLLADCIYKLKTINYNLKFKSLDDPNLDIIIKKLTNSIIKQYDFINDKFIFNIHLSSKESHFHIYPLDIYTPEEDISKELIKVFNYLVQDWGNIYLESIVFYSSFLKKITKEQINNNFIYNNNLKINCYFTTLKLEKEKNKIIEIEEYVNQNSKKEEENEFKLIKTIKFILFVDGILSLEDNIKKVNEEIKKEIELFL